MKKIIAASLLTLAIAGGTASIASAAYLDGYPHWAQSAFSPRGR